MPLTILPWYLWSLFKTIFIQQYYQDDIQPQTKPVSFNPLYGRSVNWLYFAIQASPTFLISDIRALWRSGVPKCQKLNIKVRSGWHWTLLNVTIWSLKGYDFWDQSRALDRGRAIVGRQATHQEQLLVERSVPRSSRGPDSSWWVLQAHQHEQRCEDHTSEQDGIPRCRRTQNTPGHTKHLLLSHLDKQQEYTTHTQITSCKRAK